MNHADLMTLTADMPMRQIDINGRPYLRRYYAGTTADDHDVWIHQFLSADGDRHLHSHPFNAYALVLLGGYQEEMGSGCSRELLAPERTGPEKSAMAAWIRHPARFWFRPSAAASLCRPITPFDWHRIASVQPDTWTLFVVGPERLPFWYFKDGDKLEAVKASPRDWWKSCHTRRQIEDRATLVEIFGAEQIPPLDAKAVDNPTPWGYDLWAHLHDEHGLTLMESELQEVVRLAEQVLRQDALDKLTQLSEGEYQP